MSVALAEAAARNRRCVGETVAVGADTGSALEGVIHEPFWKKSR
jgi:hypothetical protein